ncbi:MAG: hypothetical protein WEB60_11395 [Terrimicrobiaceae bacterium]
MKSFVKPLNQLFLCFLLSAVCPIAAVAQEEQKKVEAPVAEVAEAASSDEEFDLSMIPPGQPVKGLKIPYYGADGTTLQMTFEAEVARRVDDSNIELENLKIDAVGDDEKKFLVEMPQSVFNIESRMLTGENGVLIKRDDFEIRGKAAEFDIKSRFGKVLGNVHMIIYSTEEFE